MKRYYVEQMGQRLFSTDSFIVYKQWLQQQAIKRDNDLTDLTLMTSDFEGKCDDQYCNCRVNYGFTTLEADELLDQFGVDVG